jgi:molybdopterin molybdotransferase
MLEVAEALAEVLRHAKPLAPAGRSLVGGVLGRVLAEDARAEANSPPFSKSLRDGYAVRAADCTNPNAELRIVAEIAAGAVPTLTVGPGECARIFTGAPMPDGSDAVVMQENTEPLGDDRVRITEAKVKTRQWIFERGAEMRAGEVVLPRGIILNPAALGVLASIGRTKAGLFPVPAVSVLATGSELIDPYWPLNPGQIRNSNGPMLAAQIERAGGEVRGRGMCGDSPDTLRSMIQAAMSEGNIVLVAGGVSVGKFDLVPAIIEELGVAIHVRTVRMKPGKPLLFGSKGGTLVFGLPGNPVSAFVCFELFVRPALRIMAGHSEAGPRIATMPLAEAIAVTNDRPTYHPAKLEVGEVGYAVRPLRWAGAPDLRGLQPADGLLVLDPGETRLTVGQFVRVVVM